MLSSFLHRQEADLSTFSASLVDAIPSDFDTEGRCCYSGPRCWHFASSFRLFLSIGGLSGGHC